MAIIQVKDATGSVLDWMVAKCEGTPSVRMFENSKGFRVYKNESMKMQGINFAPSTAWAQGGPIIEREITKLFKNVGGTYTAQIKREIPIRPEDRGTSLATHYIDWLNVAGPTPLIAAMRCYVASKLGDQIEVPEELI